MKTISTGFPRMASVRTVEYVVSLGAPAFHEPAGYVKNIDRWLERPDIRQYKLDTPPPSVVEFCHLWPQFKGGGEDYFVADWSLGLVIYELARRQPDIQWLVVLRDPADQINSLMRYRRAEQTELFTGKWIAYHLFLLKQLRAMKKRPVVLHFGHLVAGGYDGVLADAVDKPLNPANAAFWDKKSNASSRKENKPIGGLYNTCVALQRAIIDECETL